MTPAEPVLVEEIPRQPQPDDEEPAPLPPELLERPKTKSATVPDQVLAGRRNSTLPSIAGTMRRRGMSEAAILAALLEENRTRCVPQIPGHEVKRGEE